MREATSLIAVGAAPLLAAPAGAQLTVRLRVPAVRPDAWPMSRWITVLLLAVLPGVCRAQEPSSPAPSTPVHVVSAPDENYLLGITQAWARGSALGDLRTRPLPPDGVEVRLWGGYGLAGTHGLILRRTHGRWEAWQAAVRARGRRSGPSGREVPADMLEIRDLRSRADLDATWARAVAAGLLELPPEVPRDWIMMDGHTYVLEVRQGDRYRASVIEHVEEPEADADLAIQQISVILWEPFARKRTP